MHRFTLLVALASALALGGLAATACSGDYATDESPDAGVDVVVAPGTDASPPVKGVNGVPCTTAEDCQTGACADGICCDSACTGTCESCALHGTIGTCAPIPDATDPDSECPTPPLPDAGAPDAAIDAATAFTVPDGGLPPTSANQCAGHCNGKRACAYAGTDTTCGTSFCGDATEQGRASCDGGGHCLYGVEECSAYACTDGSAGCKTSCASSTDCLSTHYCDGPTGTCKPKLANGINCTNVTQCESGVCDSTGGVCCNTDCSSTPGGTCVKSGSIGTCTCSACAGAGGCALFYADRDGDGYGDMGGSVSNRGAAYGCAVASDGAPPAGFVADHTDCFDSTVAIAASVHPGQATFFTTPYTNGGVSSFDYDCSGQLEKQLGEAGCNFANVHQFGIQQSANTSPAVKAPPTYCTFDPTCATAGEQGAHRSFGCTIDNQPAFQNAVACGASSEAYTCGTCSAIGGTAPAAGAGVRMQGCR